MESIAPAAFEETLRVGFIGAGNMASAILRGLIAKGVLKPSQSILSDVRAEAAQALAVELGARAAVNNCELMETSTLVVLATKPQGFQTVAEEIQSSLKPGHLIVSILAGTSATKIEAALAHPGCTSPRVVQVMPNTPALIGEGASALAPGTFATDADMALARRLFDAVGVTTIVRPEQMNAVTGLTGSGPAYVFLMIEGLLDAARAEGFSDADANLLVKQMVAGAALLARQSDEGPEVLRARVTSKGGTTERGIAHLESAGLRDAIRGAVRAATERARELGG